MGEQARRGHERRADGLDIPPRGRSDAAPCQPAHDHGGGAQGHGPPSPPTWAGWRDVPRLCLHPAYLKRTAGLAVVVGSLLFLINQVDVVLSGHATVLT